ncbi:MAG TPA: VOC family protein [Chloroflexota bacterium]|jgi:catechol 2,3-dioxygenase-like lactoylglutathione lyase family enzyme
MHASNAPMGGAHGAPSGGCAPYCGFGFSHLVLEVRDLDRAEAWYRDLIGLDAVGRDVLAEPAPHAVLQMNSGQLLVLLQVDEPVPIRPNTSSIHHAFLLTIDQYRAAQERFAAAGYDIGDNRAAFRAKGEYSLDIFDPDGHRWQVQAFGPENKEIIPTDAGVVDCGPAERYAVGSVTAFREGNFFLVRARDGFLALSRWCRHANGLLAHQPEHWRFFCHFHGATYDLEGTHTGHMRDIPPLRLHPVTFTPAGAVLVDTGAVVERDADEPPAYTPLPVALAGAPTA